VQVCQQHMLKVIIASDGRKPVRQFNLIITPIGVGNTVIAFLTHRSIVSKVLLSSKNRSKVASDSLPVDHVRL
jgi:hypothetical protein